jgi:hypothetical protein
MTLRRLNKHPPTHGYPRASGEAVLQRHWHSHHASDQPGNPYVLALRPSPEREREPDDPAHGPLAWRPEPEWRQLVEIMAMLGHSRKAIVREFVLRGLPCRSLSTLNRLFHHELAHGKERRLAAYGVKLHSIAMGNSPSALGALKYLLMTLAARSGVLRRRPWTMTALMCPPASDGASTSPSEIPTLRTTARHRDKPSA